MTIKTIASQVKNRLSIRRQTVFAGSMTAAGLAITVLCLLPFLIHDVAAKSIFPDQLQERFFFDLFGWIGGCWLLTYISAICQWKQVSALGQWLGIVLLCLAQVILLGLWRILPINLSYLTPLLLQVYFVGYFLGFFTMPALTLSGNRTLTGLGTLAVLLPWLLGRQVIIAGTQILHGALS